MDGPRPTRHISGPELAWFDLDPSEFVERARADEDDFPGLSERLASCRRAAWKCDSYLALAGDGGDRIVEEGVGDTAVLSEGGEDLAVDLDRNGRPVGIEFLGRLPCRSG
jgi:hypothetical protein